MQQLIQGLIGQVGLDAATAEKVITFLKENADQLPTWLAGDGAKQAIADKLPGGLGGLFG
jgi:hypothetical protein